MVSMVRNLIVIARWTGSTGQTECPAGSVIRAPVDTARFARENVLMSLAPIRRLPVVDHMVNDFWR